MRVSSDIQNLVPYKPGTPIEAVKRELGLTRVVKLASNENPLGASPRALAAIRDRLATIHLYPDATTYDVTTAVARHYRIDADRIVFGNGSDELVDLLIRIFCEPGDAILTSQGAFSAYRIRAQAARVRNIETPWTATMGFDVAALIDSALAREDVRLIFLPNPNNPTGIYSTVAQVRSLLDATAHRDVLVVFDEAYVEFVRAHDYGDSLPLIDEYPHVVSLRTFSKAYGLAGLRAGVLLGPRLVADLMHRVRLPFDLNTLAQVAIPAALSDLEHLKRVQELTWQGLDYFYDRCTRMGVAFTPSQGNFVLIDCARDADVVFRSLLQRGYITRTLKEYGLPNHLRVSVGLPDDNRGVMDALECVLLAGQSPSW